MNRRRLATVVAGAAALLLCCAVPVQAVLTPLSTHSSEISVDPSLLDAVLGTSVVEDAGNKWLLTLSIENQTPVGGGFDISEIYFNTTADVTQIKLKQVVGSDKKEWNVVLDMDNIQVEGFGLFDIGLESKDVSNVFVGAGQTVTFTLEIKTGTPPYSDTDFFDLSAPQDGQTLAYGAAHFIRGPGDQSTYGAYNPEPATICLLGFGALALLRKRKRT